MSFVAYLYIPTPAATDVSSILKNVIAAGFSISHFGRSDPPKRWSGDIDEMAHILMAQPEQNKHAFIRDVSAKTELDIQLNYDPRWSHSTISLSGQTIEVVDLLAVQLTKHLDPYLCIRGTMGDGKNQPWQLLHERSDCPSDIKRHSSAA